ncbi:hypothetical protein [Desulfitobacterium hafniense]|uniref:hypothetical protein n=1 Tax=Desulfitobacterium hafniense TaxID=49338 RepID=UPI000367326C|nr:hypothetical protein [Desulfitobacterium hafniense]
MSKFNSLCYPQMGEEIAAWDKCSKYIIKIIAPKDICVAFHQYASDFYNAAHTIASFLLETNLADISKLDTYFFSLAFLYRHSIELNLKAIAFQTIITSNDRSNFVRDTFHNLEEILSELEGVSPSPRPNKEMDWLRKYFSDISKMDKESDSFRYPFHIIREDWFESRRFTIKRIFEKQTHIDLVKFANKFEAAYEILDKWYMKSQDAASEWKELAPVFIEEGGLYYGQAVVGYAYRRDDFYPYTFAYLETAGYLRQYMKEQIDLGNYDKVSGLFLPMCYLYRNCVELNLKTIWFEETGENLQKRCKIMMDRKHSIIGMWNIIKQYVEVCANTSNDTEYIKILENYCRQLHEVDSSSSKFRYPVQKNMEPHFKENRRFDFMHTGIFLEALNNALDGISTTLDVMNEYKAEMEYEYRSEMQANCDYY